MMHESNYGPAFGFYRSAHPHKMLEQTSLSSISQDVGLGLWLDKVGLYK